MANGLPEDVKQILTEHISSVAQLEVLLFLRQEPERAWTSAEVAKALYTTREMVADQLEGLCKRGFLAAAGDSETTFRFWPSSPELSEQASRLDAAYKERSVAVITFIYSQPVQQVRTFADAFRLRKDK